MLDSTAHCATVEAHQQRHHTMPQKQEAQKIVELIARLGDDTMLKAKRAAAGYDLQGLAYIINMANGRRGYYVKISLICEVSSLLLA
jgi:hypothetical protein